MPLPRDKSRKGLNMKAWKVLVLAVLVVVVAGAIGLALLIHRGFRATTEPSRFEAVVARTMRDFAIPMEEHRRKNPLELTSQNLNDGRIISSRDARIAT